MLIRILSGFKYIRLIQTLIVVKNIHENKNNKIELKLGFYKRGFVTIFYISICSIFKGVQKCFYFFRL